MDEGAKCRILVLLPALNEEEALPQLLTELKVDFAFDFCVVDDGSTDQTSRVAQNHGAVVLRHCTNLGVGGALRTGLSYARAHGYEAVIQVDADGQHPPEGIGVLLDHLHMADLVIGARDWAKYPSSRARRAGVILTQRLLALHKLGWIKDPTSGFRAFGPAAIRLFSDAMPSHYLGDTVEALLIAQRTGLRIAQVPVPIEPRLSGNASQSLVGLAIAMLSTATFVLASRTHSGGTH